MRKRNREATEELHKAVESPTKLMKMQFPLKCKGCKNPIREFYRECCIDCGAVLCLECYRVCSSCIKFLCGDCIGEKCNRCSKDNCPNCYSVCPYCSENLCHCCTDFCEHDNCFKRHCLECNYLNCQNHNDIPQEKLINLNLSRRVVT